MKNKDIVLERLAKVGYETMFEGKWRVLSKDSIERDIWLKIADTMLTELWKAWEEEKIKWQ